LEILKPLAKTNPQEYGYMGRKKSGLKKSPLLRKMGKGLNTDGIKEGY